MHRSGCVRVRRLCLGLLVVFIALSSWAGVPGAEAAGGAFGGGDGSAGNPYVIEDVWDLQNMSSNLSAHYVLGADIDASATASWNSGAGFVPVGKRGNWFAGSLDGRNHTITGLFINRTTTDYVGLFGYVGSTGSVDNVGLVKINVTGSTYVGGLIGYCNRSTVTNAKGSGKVNGTDNYVGGLVGHLNSGSVADSHFDGTVNGTEKIGGLVGTNIGTITNSSTSGTVIGSYREVGGLAGWCLDATLRASFSDANVTARFNVGGLVGHNQRSDVNDSHAAGSVTGTDSNVGGLVGYNEAGKVINSSATGKVNGGDRDVGGLVGENYKSTVSASHATGTVTGTSNVSALVGHNYFDSTVSACYATGNVVGKERVGGLVGYNFYSCCTVSASYAKGSVTGSSEVGGLVGQNNGCAVNDSYATGTVTRSSGTSTALGGFVGYNNQGSVIDCYSTGRVVYKGVASPTNKGFAGQVTAGGSYMMGGNFWDTQTSLQTSTSGSALGRTTTKMKTRDTFTGADWNFTDVWCIRELVTYPLLRWQDGGYPYAKAGPDQTVDIGTNVVLDGSGSSDHVGIVNYTWKFTDGTLVTLHGVKPAYVFNNYGVFRITLTVRNTVGNEATDTVTVSVLEYTPPVADAGPDQTIDEDTMVTFNGSGSSDNVAVVNWTWTFTDDVDVILYGVAPTYRFNSPGLFVVTLNVSDASGNADMDTMNVTVRDLTSPSADAGPDQSIDEGTLVTFDGSGSSDNLGIVNYTWTFMDSVPITLYGVRPTYRFDGPGAFVVTLNVTDDAGHWDTDSMNVSVRDITSPVADAGSDQTIDEGTVVVFDGSGSSDNVGIVNYTWTLTDGGPVVLYGVRPSHRFDTPGAFVVKLQVTDGSGNWNLDNMTVIVNDVTQPTVEAGPDQWVDEGALVTFDGRGSVDNMGIAHYTWTFTDGGLVALHGAQPTYRFEDPGVFVVTLNVTDAAGNWDTDTMTVTVDDITSPSADAGPDRTVDEGTDVTFDGSGSVDNVGIANYTWTFMDGAAITLFGVHPSHRFDTPGDFVVILRVTDDVGNWDTDVVTITVNDITMPETDAGPDQTVDEGTVVTFDGRGSSDNVGVALYIWTFHDGSPRTIEGVLPTYRFDNPGVFVVTLNVTDAAGNWATDTVTITVNDTTPPVACAGPDQTVDEGAVVTFDGSGSYDNVGVVNWTWSFYYLPFFPETPPVHLYGETAHFTFNWPDVYGVTLAVRDAAGHIHRDYMNVTVLDVTPPVANAGPDQVVDEGTSVRFYGGHSHDKGGIENYTWTFEYGKRETVLYDGFPSFSFDIPGTYVVSLKVTDAAGHWSVDFVNITVNDITPPAADAGPDQTVDEGAVVTFDGSGSSDNVGVVNYTWTFGYKIGETVLHGVSPSFTFDMLGIYTIVLTVTDEAGHSREDNMTLTVRDITPPVADAGPDQRVPVGGTVTLDGSLSTDNGAVGELSWAFTYGGEARTLEGPVVGFTFDVAGIYEVVLTVSDLAGNTDGDTVVVTVVDTGTVAGTVVGTGGKPVGGVTVEVTASDGGVHTATTGADGTFELEVYHGAFAWKVSKKGYRAVSGTSSVEPMGETELDLSEHPLLEEEGGGSVLLYLVPVVVFVIVVIGVAVFIRARRG